VSVQLLRKDARFDPRPPIVQVGHLRLPAVSEPSSVNDQHRQELLRSSAAFATARLAFANAIVIAQRAGETDEEIAHVTGYTCR
jgi:hypothetical protein